MDISDMSLEEIAEELSMSEIQALQYLKGDSYLLGIREKIEGQAPDVEEIVSQYTQNQYVQQTIEIMPGLDVTFRTLAPQCMDEALDFAMQHKSKSSDAMSRILARRRLSYALIDVNGEPLGKMPVEGSYFSMMNADAEKFKENLREFADSVYENLCYYGLSEKISEAFGTWENVIFSRLNGIDDLSGTIKNSTRGSAKEQ